MKSRPKLGDLVDGKLTHDDNEKAELLNCKIPKLDTIHTETPLTLIEITPEKKLLQLKVTKSAGPDGFHLRILNMSSLLKRHLHKING